MSELCMSAEPCLCGIFRAGHIETYPLPGYIKETTMPIA